MQAEGEVVDLLGDSDSDDGGVVVIEQQRPAAPAASARKAGRRRAPNRDDEVVVLDDDSDDDVVMLLPPTRAGNGNGKKKRRKAASGAAIEVLDGDVEEVEEDAAAWWKKQLPAEACEFCGGLEHVLRLHGCGHGVCLSCLRRPYEDMALTGGAGPGEQQQQPAHRCPVPHCPRSLLAADDLLHLLAPVDFDAYAQRRLKVCVAIWAARRSSDHANHSINESIPPTQHAHLIRRHSSPRCRPTRRWQPARPAARRPGSAIRAVGRSASAMLRSGRGRGRGPASRLRGKRRQRWRPRRPWCRSAPPPAATSSTACCECVVSGGLASVRTNLLTY